MRVLFVCHGNICRSPMAEMIFKHLLRQRGLMACFEVASAATSTEEIGNPVYPPARRELAAHGVPVEKRGARQVAKRDYEYYDLIIGMDNANIRNIHRICGGDPAGKVSRLLDHTDSPGEVADPWYSGEFETTWEEVNSGCQALLAEF